MNPIDRLLWGLSKRLFWLSERLATRVCRRIERRTRGRLGTLELTCLRPLSTEASPSPWPRPARTNGAG